MKKVIVSLALLLSVITFGNAKGGRTSDHWGCSPEEKVLFHQLDSFYANRVARPNERMEDVAIEGAAHLIMQNASSLGQMAIQSAALALNVSNHSQNIAQLSRIEAKDLKNIRRNASGNCISYSADLPNDDVLSCDYFVAGPCKGQTHCTRIISTENGMSVMLPVRESLYSELKQLYNKQNSQLKA